MYNEERCAPTAGSFECPRPHTRAWTRLHPAVVLKSSLKDAVKGKAKQFITKVSTKLPRSRMQKSKSNQLSVTAGELEKQTTLEQDPQLEQEICQSPTAMQGLQSSTTHDDTEASLQADISGQEEVEKHNTEQDSFESKDQDLTAESLALSNVRICPDETAIPLWVTISRNALHSEIPFDDWPENIIGFLLNREYGRMTNYWDVRPRGQTAFLEYAAKLYDATAQESDVALYILFSFLADPWVVQETPICPASSPYRNEVPAIKAVSIVWAIWTIQDPELRKLAETRYVMLLRELGGRPQISALSHLMVCRDMIVLPETLLPTPTKSTL